MGRGANNNLLYGHSALPENQFNNSQISECIEKVRKASYATWQTDKNRIDYSSSFAYLWENYRFDIIQKSLNDYQRLSLAGSLANLFVADIYHQHNQFIRCPLDLRNKQSKLHIHYIDNIRCQLMRTDFSEYPQILPALFAPLKNGLSFDHQLQQADFKPKIDPDQISRLLVNYPKGYPTIKEKKISKYSILILDNADKFYTNDEKFGIDQLEEWVKNNKQLVDYFEAPENRTNKQLRPIIASRIIQLIADSMHRETHKYNKLMIEKDHQTNSLDLNNNKLIDLYYTWETMLADCKYSKLLNRTISYRYTSGKPLLKGDLKSNLSEIANQQLVKNLSQALTKNNKYQPDINQAQEIARFILNNNYRQAVEVS
jgi:hypothetical protein